MFVGYGYMIMDLSKNGSFKIKKNIMLILLFCFSLVISTIWNSSQLKQFLLVIRYILPVLAFCVYFNGISEEKKNTFLKALCIIHAILIVANFATVLIFPDVFIEVFIVWVLLLISTIFERIVCLLKKFVEVCNV